MLTKLDLVWAAQALIWEHGEDAATEAEKQANSYLDQGSTEAHQVVMHVHFHIIPKIGDQGLGIGWQSGSLDPDRAEALLSDIRRAMADED